MIHIRRFIVWTCIGFTFYYAVFSWYRIVSTTAPDFSVFYGAAKRLWEGKSLSGDTGLYTGFGYPPTTLLLFLPFLVFSYETAQMFWVTVSLLCIPVIVWLSFRFAKYRHTWSDIFVWSCLVFWSFPTRWTIGMGQVNIVSLVLLLLSVLFLRANKAVLATLVLFMLLLSKPHFIVVFPILFIMGKWRACIGAIVLYVIATWFIVVVFGYEYILSYVQHELPILLEFRGREIYYNQSLAAFFSRVLPLDIARIATFGVSIILLIVCMLFSRNARDWVGVFSIVLPIFLLIEPLAWQHHAVFILPVYIWLWFTGSYRLLLIISFILISWNIKNPQIIHNPFMLSHGFFGIVILLLARYTIYARRIKLFL
ncbi:MAG: DUF2029 domain-containing protein [Patescibacteria group bacterium]|nr:DUF2029 domain-containing protein [Patescibacteria group bacterium]